MNIVDFVDLQPGAEAVGLVGGKAASIARLMQLGVNSPKGFCITTNAYAEHVNRAKEEKRLAVDLGAALESGWSNAQLGEIRKGIVNTDFSERFRRDLTSKLVEFEQIASVRPLRVAVRSSANIEDLPRDSFAGQYDTFLNVGGIDAILDSVKRCWASLWSDRAYSYGRSRASANCRMQMAVVIQELIRAESAGTMFTANPVTGNTSETVIEATWGLGELLVSGRITPDLYVVNASSPPFSITDTKIRKKKLMLAPKDDGTGLELVEVPDSLKEKRVLTDEQVLSLVEIGRFLLEHLGTPLDIEWSYLQRSSFILQARPITVLEKS